MFHWLLNTIFVKSTKYVEIWIEVISNRLKLSESSKARQTLGQARSDKKIIGPAQSQGPCRPLICNTTLAIYDV